MGTKGRDGENDRDNQMVGGGATLAQNAAPIAITHLYEALDFGSWYVWLRAVTGSCCAEEIVSQGTGNRRRFRASAVSTTLRLPTCFVYPSPVRDQTVGIPHEAPLYCPDRRNLCGTYSAIERGARAGRTRKGAGEYAAVAEAEDLFGRSPPSGVFLGEAVAEDCPSSGLQKGWDSLAMRWPFASSGLVGVALKCTLGRSHCKSQRLLEEWV